MKTNIEIARDVLRKIGGEASRRFEAIPYAGQPWHDQPADGWCVHSPGHGSFVPCPGGKAQAHAVVALLDEILGRGTKESHDSIVRACNGGKDHEWEVLYRCRHCGFLVSELP